MWAEELGLWTVPELYSGTVFSEKDLQDLTEKLVSKESVFGKVREGVVIRVADGFEDKDFSNSVMKWVRKDHVQTSDHWRTQEIVRNKLLGSVG